jgi:hypothetical protein
LDFSKESFDEEWEAKSKDELRFLTYEAQDISGSTIDLETKGVMRPIMRIPSRLNGLPYLTRFFKMRVIPTEKSK